ncbi:MAG: hypothetical protein COB94_003890 [Gammaproteobacteria bacterium]|nr:hypothetical protein [Gammaproteobacteria bacterium]
MKGSLNVFKVVDGQFVIDQEAETESEIRETVSKCTFWYVENRAID